MVDTILSTYFGGAVMKINKDMSITDIVGQYPDTIEVFNKYGMHCFG